MCVRSALGINLKLERKIRERLGGGLGCGGGGGYVVLSLNSLFI